MQSNTARRSHGHPTRQPLPTVCTTAAEPAGGAAQWQRCSDSWELAGCCQAEPSWRFGTGWKTRGKHHRVPGIAGGGWCAGGGRCICLPQSGTCDAAGACSSQTDHAEGLLQTGGMCVLEWFKVSCVEQPTYEGLACEPVRFSCIKQFDEEVNCIHTIIVHVHKTCSFDKPAAHALQCNAFQGCTLLHIRSS